VNEAQEGCGARDLVIGAAIGLTLAQVAPFLRSLRNTGYAGSTVLFVHPALKRALRKDPLGTGLTLIRASQWPPFKLGLLERPRVMRSVWAPLQRAIWTLLKVLRRIPCREELRLALQMPVVHLVYTPMETRFLRCLRFVASHPHERVLLTDVRDVLFQTNPFAQLPNGGLAVSIETPSYTVATESHNAAWLARAYGTSMLAKIGANRVSCVGVRCGDATAIKAYLRLFEQELLSMSPAAAGIGGADTAIHNKLLWTHRLGCVHLLEPLASAVTTCNGIDEAEVRLSPEGRVLNLDGSEASVLHQYDRLPGLRLALLRTLVDGRS
jgi:hypothetical protein